MGTTSYAIALGSNRWHGRYGAPAGVVAAAIDALAAQGLRVTARSAIRATPAMGPAGRSFANAAVIVASEIEPLALLDLLKSVERSFGRRGSKRWGPRVLDLDILLRFPGEGRVPGSWPRCLGAHLRRGTPAIPHPGLATRDFVLQPLKEIAPAWRHPPTGLTVRQLRARLRRARPINVRPVARNVRLA